MRGPWEFEDASCNGIDTEIFYPVEKYNPPNLEIIRTICGRCPERSDCLSWALTHERFGIWAGTTEADRNRLRKSRNITVREIGVA